MYLARARQHPGRTGWRSGSMRMSQRSQRRPHSRTAEPMIQVSSQQAMVQIRFGVPSWRFLVTSPHLGCQDESCIG